MLFQQGDILIESASIPKTAKKLKSVNGRLILAEGEATGHAHTITKETSVDLFEEDGKLWLRAGKEVKVKHEEHKMVTIPIGEFEIRKVQEYDHFAEETRNVTD